MLFRYLPQEMKKKQTKTILCARNPKDTAVSYFNHLKGLTGYGYSEGKWENFPKLFLEGKRKLSINVYRGIYTGVR